MSKAITHREAVLRTHPLASCRRAKDGLFEVRRYITTHQKSFVRAPSASMAWRLAYYKIVDSK